MCDYVSRIRELYWSDLCVGNIEAYRSYLQAVQDGLRVVVSGDLDGTAELFGRQRGSIDNDVGFEPSSLCCGDDGNCEVVGVATHHNSAVGAKDNVDRDSCEKRLVVIGGGLPADSVDNCERGAACSGVDAGVPPACVESRDTAVDGRPVGLPVRGPNYERNRMNRMAKKNRKRLQAGVQRERDVAPLEEPQGFWNSCSPDVRRALIDSKAKMHIAENERREKESRVKSEELDSPYAIMQKAVKMAEYAEKQASRDKCDQIYGWAKTVATSSAESLARSVPSSVPSFAELQSVTSMESVIRLKDAEIAERDQRVLDLSKTIDQLRVELAGGRCANDSVSIDAPAVSESGVRSGKFVKTKAQPWPHVRITAREHYCFE